MEAQCDECEYKGRNLARVEKHKEVKHHHWCDPCGDWYFSDAIFAKHNLITHENLDKTLTEKEIYELDEDDIINIKRGPDTPRKLDLIKRHELKEQKEKEERRSRRAKK